MTEMQDKETKEMPVLPKAEVPPPPREALEKSGSGPALPKPPVLDDYKDADSFKTAIRDWAAVYELAYSQAYPAREAAPPPDPGPEPAMPPGPPEPERRDSETREEHGKRLAEWLPKQEKWFFREYLPWEITRTAWYVARNTQRDWEALRRLEARQRKEFKHRLVVAILRFAVTGVVAGAMVLAGLRIWG